MPSAPSAAVPGSGTAVAVKLALLGAKSEMAALPENAPSRGHRLKV
jgi:hypothetical protein